MRTRHGCYYSSGGGAAVTATGRTMAMAKRRCCQQQQDWTSAAGSFSGSRRNKRARLEASAASEPSSSSSSPFDALHDDLVTKIIAALSSTASSPADLVNTMLTCRRFCAIAKHPQVLSVASVSAMDVKFSSWSDGAMRFLKHCSDAGNTEASYTVGMINFYCLGNRARGSSLMAKAAMASHAPALHSLAVVQFNGSGGSRKDKDLKAGVALCWRAALLGHVDAMREMGHCLQDGYGIVRNVTEGRRLLLEANTREAAAAVAQSHRSFVEAALRITTLAAVGSGVAAAAAAAAAAGSGVACLHHHLHYYSALGKAKAAAAAAAAATAPLQPAAPSLATGAAAAARSREDECGSSGGGSNGSNDPVYRLLQGRGCSLLSDYGCNVPPPKVHVANRFLVDWFAARPPSDGLRLCSHANCGRPETRKHEFRRCSACGSVNYCSRACQALDWKIRHKADCRPVDWEEQNEAEEEDEEDDEQQQQQQQLQEQQREQEQQEMQT